MTYSLRNLVSSLNETRLLAQAIAPSLRTGDVITLHGELGVGKTTFARALISALALEGEEVDVPSPTFPMVQLYELSSVNVWHFDLYRINDSSELEELGFTDALESGVVIIEWPERSGGALPASSVRLDISISSGESDEERVFLFECEGEWERRIRRLEEVAVFLDFSGWKTATCRYLHGDASTRLFQRLEQDGQRAILVDASRKMETPSSHDGKSYKDLVHLNDGVCAFIAIDGLLRQHGFSAPEIIFADIERNLLLVEDLGTGGIVEGVPPAPIAERYRSSVDVLVRIAAQDWPRIVRVGDEFKHNIAMFSDVALLTEAELILDWFAPLFLGAPLDDKARVTFADVWADVFLYLREDPYTLTLRDFHSPNIIWCDDRDGLMKVGLIDFQDAVLAHPAYDVVSLLQDARVDVSVELEDELLSHYIQETGKNKSFRDVRFRRAYAVMGAQRNCKILGLFVRLARRDGKDGYVRHLPRAADYLRRNLAHPDMVALRRWFENNLPMALDPSFLSSEKIL